MPSGKKAAVQQGFDELKLKYLTVDRNYETLKTLTRRALFEFDQLKKKSKEDVVMLEKERKSNEDISKELEEIQAEHEKLKETSARAFDEYGELVTRFEKQQELKEKAESLATDLSHENKVLKRNLESKTQLGATENQKLIAQLEEITMENSTLKQEVDDLKESMEYLTKKYGDKEKDHVTLVRAFSSATEKVAEMEKEKEDKVLVDRGTFERLQKASEMALEEINSLSEKLESEQRLRREAEHIAHQNLTEANALKRQSAIVLSSVIEEQQLTEALMEVESLNNKIAELEKESKDKITDLQSELEGLQESTLLEENRKLEEKLSLVTAEAESLATNSHASEQKVVELQTKVVDYEQQITDLNQKVEEAQQAAAAASTSNAANEDAVGGAPPPPPGPPPPPPPPPPAAPPPPPPPPPPTTTSLSNLIKVKKPASSPSTERKATIGKPAAEDPMAEMLARIKSGNVHLRKIEAATSEKKKPENDIMAEMSKLLASGKRPGGRSRVPPSTKPKPKPSDSQVSGELAAMLKRRKKKQGEDVTDKGKAAEEETSSREASVEPAEEVVDEDKKDAQDEKEAKDVEDKEGKQDNETAPAEGTTDKERKFATVKERMDTLERVKVRKHAPLEKKTSSKVKIPDVFQSPQHSPLTAHKSPITDVSIHVSYSQDDDDTFEPTSNTDQNVDKTGDSKVDDQGEDQPAATESTTASTDHASDEAITDKEPQVEEQQPAGQVTEEPSTSTPQENKPAEQEQDSKHTEQEQDSKHTEQVEQDTKPVEQADQYAKPVEHVGQDEPPPEMSTKTVDQTEEVESKEEQSTESTNQQISDEGTVTTEGDKETEKVQEQATDEKTTEGDQPNAPSDEVDETANQPED